ncbi:hypothetical protein CERSUDRAFT_94423 [Gelatoporia subvermispora B]|uniref:Uncharacterized protein n=1 Tax=Ceriporiopsis subvermispora (strain B) TaxID=914234 RepID=M2RF35_CERS8|nr:hypothetical protein CERSUDRAFT_94423 [Gelatoporia subvermispora B]
MTATSRRFFTPEGDIFVILVGLIIILVIAALYYSRNQLPWHAPPGNIHIIASRPTTPLVFAPTHTYPPPAHTATPSRRASPPRDAHLYTARPLPALPDLMHPEAASKGGVMLRTPTRAPDQVIWPDEEGTSHGGGSTATRSSTPARGKEEDSGYEYRDE